MNLFCVSKHLDTPGHPTQKNYHLANTDTRCYFLKSKKNASKKEESQQTDEKSNSKADQSDKNETDCRPNQVMFPDEEEIAESRLRNLCGHNRAMEKREEFNVLVSFSSFY